MIHEGPVSVSVSVSVEGLAGDGETKYFARNFRFLDQGVHVRLDDTQALILGWAQKPFLHGPFGIHTEHVRKTLGRKTENVILPPPFIIPVIFLVENVPGKLGIGHREERVEFLNGIDEVAFVLGDDDVAGAHIETDRAIRLQRTRSAFLLRGNKRFF